MKSKTMRILLALPMAFQDGIEKYNGIMRYLKQHELDWRIQLDRLSPSLSRPTISEWAKFDGAIIDGYASLELVRAYIASSLPIIALDWHRPEINAQRQRLVRIDVDNADIGRRAADILQDIGTFASFACLPTNLPWALKRQETFVRRLRRRHVDVRTLNPSLPLGPQLRKLPKPSAIFAVNDNIGAKVLEICAQEGLAVPDEFSVIGVDNDEYICRHTTPPLASIQPDCEQAGYLAARTLHNLLNGHPTPAHRAYGIRSLAARASMGPARSAARLVQRAMELIENPKTYLTDIEGLARQLGVSRRLLDLRFREIRSQTVLEAITDTRMARVCSLLRSTNLTIQEICAMSELGSGTYPLRAFHRRFGMTMGEYRRSKSISRP